MFVSEKNCIGKKGGKILSLEIGEIMEMGEKILKGNEGKC